MSLFSGMKISSGSGGRSDKDTLTGEKSTTSQEKSTSAFGFITGTKEDESASQKKTPSGQDNVQSKFQFINTTADEAKTTHSKHKTGILHQPAADETKADLDFNLDLGLDLDLELDPLRTQYEEADVLRRGKSNTDLEGIDFSTDLDINTSYGDNQCGDKAKGRLSEEGVENSNDLKVDMPDEQNERTAALGASQFGFISESLPQHSAVRHENVDQSHPVSCLDDERATSQIGFTEGALSHNGSEVTDTVRKGEEEGFVASGSLYDVELDVNDMLEVLQEAQAAADQQLREAQEALISMLKALGQERMTAMHSLIRKQKRLNELHTLQVQAISEENYEMAEVLTRESTSLEGDLRRIPSVTLHQDNAVQDVFRRSRDMEDRREDQRAQWVRSYKDLLSQQETMIARVREKRANDSSEEQKHRLEAQRAELERTLGHVLLDKDHVTKRESQLLARIDEKTADLRETKQNLLSQKTTVQGEIAALEEQLAKLRLEEASLNMAIARQDDAIEAVKVAFQEEASALEQEKSKVEEQEDRLNEEQRGLDEMEKALAEETQHFQSRIASEESLLLKISQALNMISSSTKQGEGLSSQKFGTTDLSSELQPCKDVICLREKLQSATSVIQSTSALILSNQAKLATSKKKVMETEDHIATLQGAKQFAVTTKSFGEAKRLAEEIKTRMAEGQAFQAEVEALSEELKKDKGRVEDLQEQVEKMKAELAEMEKTWELGMLERARGMIADITTRLEDHGIGDSENPGSAALVCQMLEMERRVIALLVGWLSDRHGYPRPPDVDRLIQEYEDHAAAVGSGNRAETADDAELQKHTRSDDRSDEVKAELLQLEERLQVAIEEEDYDAAEHIQARIDYLQQC